MGATNMKNNPYVPWPSKILDVIRHTQKEYTFRMEYVGDVKPGQFFEVSIPKYGEAPISVSGIGPNFVDLTIRKVGRVTGEVFEKYKGQSLLLRGPYGNGFDTSLYENGEVIVIAGGGQYRRTKGERMRFKVLHKIFDFRKRFGYDMCVGCGRCDMVCPEYISFPACINKVAKAVEEEVSNGSN